MQVSLLFDSQETPLPSAPSLCPSTHADAWLCATGCQQPSLKTRPQCLPGLTVEAQRSRETKGVLDGEIFCGTRGSLHGGLHAVQPRPCILLLLARRIRA